MMTITATERPQDFQRQVSYHKWNYQKMLTLLYLLMTLEVGSHSTPTSVYSLSNNVTASVSGPFCCPCGEIFFGNGTKLNCEVNSWDYQMDYTILFWLCVTLSVSLIPMAVLICCMKTCDCCNGPVITEQQNQHLFNLQTDEDTRVYSTVIFTMEKLVVMDRRGKKQQR